MLSPYKGKKTRGAGNTGPKWIISLIIYFNTNRSYGLGSFFFTLKLPKRET